MRWRFLLGVKFNFCVLRGDTPNQFSRLREEGESAPAQPLMRLTAQSLFGKKIRQ